MLVIASNITSRSAKVDRIFRTAKAEGWKSDQFAARAIQAIAHCCADAGADVLEINTQQHHDRPEAMEFAVKAIQQVTDRRLCLSTNNPDTLKAGLKACKKLPIANYIGLDEARLKEMLPVIADSGADVILMVSDPVSPTDAQEMMEKASILVGAARESGIANNQIFVDPGLVHVTRDIGQRHLVEVMEFLRTLPEVFDPPVGSTCWLANSSAGAARRVRTMIETALLPMLAGVGLSSVFLDALKPVNMRTIQLIKVFNNETVYSDGGIEQALVKK